MIDKKFAIICIFVLVMSKAALTSKMAILNPSFFVFRVTQNEKFAMFSIRQRKTGTVKLKCSIQGP